MSERRTFMKRVGAVGVAGITTLAGCSSTGGSSTTAGGESYRDGEIDMNLSPSVAQERLDDQYGPIRDYLAEELGTEATMSIANNYSSVIQALGSGTSDVAETGPFAAALGVNADKANIILQRKGFGSWTYVSTIATRKDSDIQNLDDLKAADNPTIAFADRLSTSGALYPLFDMKTKADIDIGNLPEGDGSEAEFEPVFAGGHTAAYETLVNGQAVAAGMGGFVAGIKDGFSDNARFINKHEGLPRAPIVTSPRLSKEETTAITEAFVNAPDSIYYGADGKEGTDDDLWFNAVRKASVKDYKSVIDVAKELNVGTSIFKQ